MRSVETRKHTQTINMRVASFNGCCMKGRVHTEQKVITILARLLKVVKENEYFSATIINSNSSKVNQY